MFRCPYCQDLKIYCEERKCSAACPIFAKESGQLAEALNEMLRRLDNGC